MKLFKNIYYYCKFFLIRTYPNNILVSIVIPVFNAEAHLKKTIPTLLKQSYFNLEFVFVDDGSSDRSIMILHDFAKKDARIKVLMQENQGPGAARNTGLLCARGEYILFHDADDYLYKNAVKRLLAIAIKTRSEVIAGTSYVQKENRGIKRDSLFRRWDLNINFHEQDKKAKHYTSHVSVCNKLFLKQFLIKNNLLFMEKVYFEDSEFWARIMFYSKNYSQCPYPISLYRYHRDSYTRGDVFIEKIDSILTSFFIISARFNSLHKQLPSNLFSRYFNYIILHKPFGFTLRRVIFSSSATQQLHKIHLWLQEIPEEHLIDFYYDKNQRLSLIYLAMRRGDFMVAKRLYQHAYRKKIINRLKKLQHEGTAVFYQQFLQEMWEHIEFYEK
ncbi:glycosyltransferase family 2 protein [Legionella septentrionalis]|uniref:glycosyltransferase family 2 protein n=1 Tax=Legionella septentrionalis TaxID=2498109 RepID=UPI000F8CDFB0|nr:glycosyltransferase family 2 protein [Legionella septentrionalis]RUR16743.1 glycosyltransferase family 2 protein [Legionella septentrionalis]